MRIPDGPGLMGRGGDGSPPEDVDAGCRASTEQTFNVRMEYVSGAIGTVHVDAFESVDDEDRGGAVIRIVIDDDSCSFFPYAEVIPGGVELHLCGDAECDAVLACLKAAVDHLLRRRS